jgi:hypothetical protein
MITEAERMGISEPTLRRAYRDLGGVDPEQERDLGTGPDGFPRLATFSPQ